MHPAPARPLDPACTRQESAAPVPLLRRLAAWLARWRAPAGPAPAGAGEQGWEHASAALEGLEPHVLADIGAPAWLQAQARARHEREADQMRWHRLHL
ncbi:hypothetical protein V8Z80_04010 [Orrella sp. JC864]|uniref:hypothetical protein n=1 Tax=Orrella sp. JC864 TaxID=3120298 RepID=UPI00300B44C3